MADIRIKDLATTASTTASDDFLAVDGTTNGTRKLSAATPSFATSVTVPGVVGPTSTDLTLTGGTSGASLVLGQGTTAADVTVTPKGTGIAVISGPLVVGASSSVVQTAWTGAGYAGRIMFPDSSNFSLFSEPNALYRGGGMLTNIARVGGSWGFVDSTKPAWRVYFGNGALSDNFSIFRSASTTYSESSLLQLTGTGNLLIGTTTDAASLAGGLVVNGSGAGATASSTTTGALRVTGGVGVSGAGYFGGVVSVTRSVNTLAGSFIATNTSAGAGAGGVFSASNGTASGWFGISGTGYTTYGIQTANSVGVYTDQSIFIASDNPSGRVKIGVGSGIPAVGDFSATGLAVTGTLSTTGAATFAGAINLSASGQANAKQIITNTDSASYAHFNLVSGVSQTATLYQFGSTYTTAGRYIQGSAVLETGGAGGLNLATSAATPIRFYTNGDNLRMTIASAGDVSINSTTPSTGVGTGSLQTAGGIYAGAASVFGSTVRVGDGTEAAPSLSFNNYATTGLWTFDGTNIRVSVGGTRRFLLSNNSTIYGEGNASSIRLASTGTITLDTTGGTALTLAPTTLAATFAGAVSIGNTVGTAAAVASTHKVTMVIGGVTYYLLATNV